MQISKYLIILLLSLFFTISFAITEISGFKEFFKLGAILYSTFFLIFLKVTYLVINDLFSFLKVKPRRAFLLSVYFVSLYLILDLFYYMTFKIHIYYTFLSEAKHAIKIGAVPVQAMIIVFITSVFISVLLIFYLIVRFSEKFKPTVTKKIIYKYSIATLILLFISIHLLPKRNIDLRKLQNAFFRYPIRKFQLLPNLFKDLKKVNYETEKLEMKSLKKIENALQNFNIQSTKKPNILFVHVEGWRSDTITEEITPNLYKFTKKDAHLLKNHYTTGNGTRSGTAGALSGLSCYFFPLINTYNYNSIPLTILKKLGYTRSIYLNEKLSWNNTYDEIFKNSIDKYNLITSGDYVKDAKSLINKYIEDINGSNSSPRFDYLAFYFTHYNYYYPKNLEKFKPVLPSNFKISSNSKYSRSIRFYREGLLNRYKNSVLFADFLINKIIEDLRVNGRLKNTIIFLFGDHGEEFWENGRFGHSWGLTQEQIKTAGIVYFQPNKEIQYEYTSHQDIFPTIFDLMGINMNYKNFMNGKSLVRFNSQSDFAISYKTTMYNRRQHSYLVVGEGYKINYKYKKDEPLKIINITDLKDNDVYDANPKTVKDLVLKALELRKLKKNKFH